MLVPADTSLVRSGGSCCLAPHHSFVHVPPLDKPPAAAVAAIEAATAAAAKASTDSDDDAAMADSPRLWIVAGGKSLSLRAAPLASSSAVTSEVWTVIPGNSESLLTECPPTSVTTLGSVVALAIGYARHAQPTPPSPKGSTHQQAQPRASRREPSSPSRPRTRRRHLTEHTVQSSE